MSSPRHDGHGRVRRLTDGRVLTLRRMRPADGRALADLYGRLPAEDRYSRFFSAFTPDESFTDREVRVHERGGLGLVVELTDGDGAKRLVASATAEPLDDGDGELAIVVDPDWRGWLAGYLLDALCDAAAEVGMRNLQAEVLCANGAMLGLLRRRGVVIVGEASGPTIRVAIGAGHPTPGWPTRAPHPRVLAEVPGGRWLDAARIVDGGGSVLTCPGPSPAAPDRCPLLRGTPCPLISGADVVVCRLRHDLDGDAVRDEVGVMHPGVRLEDAMP